MEFPTVVYWAAMVSQLLTVAFDAHDAVRVALFWAGMLGREIFEDSGGALLPGEDTQLTLRFVPSRATKVGLNRMHLHLTSASPADQQHTVAKWDQNQETAIQLPHGGTKVAWGGPPVAPMKGRNRQRFEFALGGDQEAEIARLVSLGATQLESGEDSDAVVMVDPDGNEFCLKGA